MLDDACEDCGNPLFRYQGEVLCPVCRKRAEATDEDEEAGGTGEAGGGTEPERDTERAETGAETDTDAVDQHLRVLAERLARDAAERADDPDAVERRLDALERTLGLLRRG